MFLNMVKHGKFQEKYSIIFEKNQNLIENKCSQEIQWKTVKKKNSMEYEKNPP